MKGKYSFVPSESEAGVRAAGAAEARPRWLTMTSQCLWRLCVRQGQSLAHLEPLLRLP